MRWTESVVNKGTRPLDRRFQVLVGRLYGWACERLYHELAWGYEVIAAVVSLGRWGQWRRMALGDATGECVLELGFGTGALLVEGSGERRMFGIDPSAEMQHVAGRRLAAHGLSGRCVQGRGQALPLAAACMDTVLATFPASYILERSTLEECRRVLVPGGRLVISGLWVHAELQGWERGLALFYGRPAREAQELWVARLAEVGFEPRLDEREDRIFRVGIMIAVKR